MSIIPVKVSPEKLAEAAQGTKLIIRRKDTSMERKPLKSKPKPMGVYKGSIVYRRDMKAVTPSVRVKKKKDDGKMSTITLPPKVRYTDDKCLLPRRNGTRIYWDRYNNLEILENLIKHYDRDINRIADEIEMTYDALKRVLKRYLPEYAPKHKDLKVIDAKLIELLNNTQSVTTTVNVYIAMFNEQSQYTKLGLRNRIIKIHTALYEKYKNSEMNRNQSYIRTKK